ncbi:MAG: sensor histidine kinase [Nocardioidaceae bacterium]|nr:sensor histidine kinase [Nocardioidaceae bacterium]
MVVVVVAAVALAYLDARRTQLDTARDRSVDVARAVADSPAVLAALRTPDPSAGIQPYAERVRRDTGTDFVVVMGLDRTRYSHPDPSQIGKRFIGDLGGAPRGHVFTQEHTGTLGRSMRAVVPVVDGDRVVALVAVGITLEKIGEALRERLLPIGLAAGLILAGGALGAWLISRRLRRQTHGLGEQQITRMYEYYDAVLHAVREGLLLLDDEGRVQLVNDEALRLLGLVDAVGVPVESLGLPGALVDSLRTGSAGPDEIHLVGDAVLVVNQAEARWEGRHLGSVVTLRDHTELRAVSGELDTVRGMAEALRAQNHEAANRLHTVVSLIEMDRAGEAVEFATSSLQAAQVLTDAVVSAVDDPVVAALLLGKSAQAAERGIDLSIDAGSRVRGLPVESRELVTLLGNLLDNAFDAVGAGADRRVQVHIVGDATALAIDVGDSGPGLPAGLVEDAFARGWSTKRGDDALGRGLGLALVAQVVRRYDGTVSVDRSDLGGALFRVRIPS